VTSLTAVQELLAGYPVHLDIPVAWGEMDAFGHVNNVVYIRYLESARIAYIRALDLPEFLGQSGIGPILAAIHCRYKAPVVFPDTLTVGTRVRDVGHDRFTVQHAIASHAQQRIVAEGEGVVVCYDYRAGRKAPVPDVLRERIAAMESYRERSTEGASA
jgi:acyl-CoA thioester hydrolase